MTPKTVSLTQPGERTSPDGKAISNRILLNVPEEEFALLRPRLEWMELPHHCIVHHPGRPLDYACFPNRGLISTVVSMQGGGAVEAGLVGSEGCTGVPLAVNLRSTPLQQVVQIEGDGYRLDRAALDELLARLPQFRFAMTRYAVIQGLQIAQTAACNRLHGIEQRLARWLLMAVDRVYAGLLPVTHDFLATVLGTDRPTVTVAAGRLQDLRAIEYVPGAVRVVNHHTLQQSARECYGVVRDRLLPVHRLAANVPLFT
ncbi:MAG TPA: Crp/Fnr family transcriptional regulator [Candidatus Dormibacteraeota bacterium]|nr:Crp/Fnr family transcriptional regulator [Candidatus Dormibacteraeota bacterium]